MRLMIIGNGGAGKSTLATRLGVMTGWPVVHLDQLFWNPGWVETPKDDYRASQRELLMSTDDWIVDGNYGGTMDERLRLADIVLWLDFPRLTCVRGIMTRRLTYRSSRTRPDMSPGCPERIELNFLRYVWTYRTVQNPRVEKQIVDAGKADVLVKLRSRREAASWVNSFSSIGLQDGL